MLVFAFLKIFVCICAFYEKIEESNFRTIIFTLTYDLALRVYFL